MARNKQQNDAGVPELQERVVYINRVSKVVKGGRRFALTALVVGGDGNGRVGVGMGKSQEVPIAIKKGVEDAKKNMFTVPLTPEKTLPHEIMGIYGAGRVLIKRCIAVGGQTVDLVDGRVVVDGVALDEPYTRGLPSEPLKTALGVEVSYPYTVPEGHLWVMGDNRTNSNDSRYFGAVDEDTLTGRAALVYWPFNNFGLLD